MRPLRWQHWLSQGGVQSFRATRPEETKQLLQGITHGIPVDFVGERGRARYGPNLPIDPGDVSRVQAVIDADVAAGKKAGPFDEAPFPIMNVSPIGVVPKKNGKIRVIHHLSFPFGGDSINAGVRDIGYRLSSFGHAAQAVRQLGKGCWLLKLDVEAAFKQVPVRPEDWHLLGFKWKGKWYYERVLPFGLRSSCRLWELYAAALHHLFERVLAGEGISGDAARIVIHYVDDFLFVVRCSEQARAVLAAALVLCEDLGLPMAADKTEGPVQCLTFLGIELDTVAMEARLPAAKLSELHRLCMVWRDKTHATMKELQSLQGLLQFACAVVRPGRFYLRRITARIAVMESKGTGRHAQWPLTRDVRADVAWWDTYLTRWNGHSLLYERDWLAAKRIELFTDACQDGYGARYGQYWLAGVWRPKHRAAAQRRARYSMPFYELYALVAAARAWGHLWRCKKITFRCDCDPVVQAITRCRSKSREMMHLLRVLSETAIEHGFDFRCEHIPGVDNSVADILSRLGDCAQFRAACPNAALLPTPLPEVPLPELPPQ